MRPAMTMQCGSQRPAVARGFTQPPDFARCHAQKVRHRVIEFC